MKKINLYWWNTKCNVGDYASYYLMSKLFRWKIKRKDPTIQKKCFIKFILGREDLKTLRYFVYPWDKYIAGIGSIIDHLDNNAIVWGSGCRHEQSLCPQNAKYYLVRGHLTIEVLKTYGVNVENIHVGDPGLLMPRVYTPKKHGKSNGVVVIPHYNDYEDIYKIFHTKYPVLDVRTNNIENFIDNICSADFIISSSLHGLIFANAYGIPAVWFKHNYINSSDFKFYDYLSSIGISQYKPIAEIESYANKDILSLKESDCCINSERETIRDLQQNILNMWNQIIYNL